MDNDVATNKLSVYLIKEKHGSPKDFLKEIDKLKKVDIDNVGTFYYDDSQIYKPSWVKSFFKNEIQDLDIFNSGSKAILIVALLIGSKENHFAIPFGYGWTLLSPGVWEERFGLKIALNTVDSSSLRRITKKNISSIPKDTSEQLGRAGQASDFGIDIEQDLVQSITAVSKDELFGKAITGKDPLSVSVKVDITNIKPFLQSCHERYNSNKYKEEFGWIDQISDVKDTQVIEELNGQLLAKLRERNLEKLWIAVPELVEWENIKGFKYAGVRRDPDLHDDLNITKYLDVVLGNREDSDLDLKDFENHILAISSHNDQIIYNWKAYSCLYCEITQRGRIYLLSNGKWYEIENDFAVLVNEDFDTLRARTPSIDFPDYSHDSEASYNEAIATESNFACMDKKNIQYGGGYSRIEFCDMMTPKKQLIHVKKYGNSSVLSHLFAQGLVSGELFLGDIDFRKKLNEKLPDSYKLNNPNDKPSSSEYEVIFAIVSNSKLDLEIPFFSKVALRNAKRRLETFGYNVSLIKIYAPKE